MPVRLGCGRKGQVGSQARHSWPSHPADPPCAWDGGAGPTCSHPQGRDQGHPIHSSQAGQGQSGEGERAREPWGSAPRAALRPGAAAPPLPLPSIPCPPPPTSTRCPHQSAHREADTEPRARGPVRAAGPWTSPHTGLPAGMILRRPCPELVSRHGPHLEAADDQQGVDVVGADVLHDLLQVALGQRPAAHENQTNMAPHAGYEDPSTRQPTAGDMLCPHLEVDETRHRGTCGAHSGTKRPEHLLVGRGGPRLPQPRSPLPARRDVLHGHRATREALPAQVTSVSSQPRRGRQEVHQPEVGTQFPATGQVSPCTHLPQPSLLCAFPSPSCPRWPGSPGPQPAAHLLVPSMEPPRPSQPATSCQLTSCTCGEAGEVQPRGTGRAPFLLRRRAHAQCEPIHAGPAGCAGHGVGHCGPDVVWGPHRRSEPSPVDLPAAFFGDPTGAIALTLCREPPVLVHRAAAGGGHATHTCHRAPRPHRPDPWPVPRSRHARRTPCGPGRCRTARPSAPPRSCRPPGRPHSGWPERSWSLRRRGDRKVSTGLGGDRRSQTEVGDGAAPGTGPGSRKPQGQTQRGEGTRRTAATSLRGTVGAPSQARRRGTAVQAPASIRAHLEASSHHPPLRAQGSRCPMRPASSTDAWQRRPRMSRKFSRSHVKSAKKQVTLVLGARLA